MTKVRRRRLRTLVRRRNTLGTPVDSAQKSFYYTKASVKQVNFRAIRCLERKNKLVHYLVTFISVGSRSKKAKNSLFGYFRIGTTGEKYTVKSKNTHTGFPVVTSLLFFLSFFEIFGLFPGGFIHLRHNQHTLLFNMTVILQ
jgi:hypothetical protein